MALTYEALNLPDGLAINANTGVISGTPTGSGGFSLLTTQSATVTATDGNGDSEAATVNFQVINKGADAVGWYDMTPATLKTDLVRELDGSTKFFSISDGAQSGLDFGASDSFTFALWIKPTSLTGLHWVQRKGSSSSATLYGYDMYLNGANIVASVTGQDGGGSKGAGGPSALVINQWAHVGFVVDRAANTLTVYKNGSAGTPIDISTVGSLDGTSSFFLGAASSGASVFAGQLTCATMWGRALSGAEMTTLANGGAMYPKVSWSPALQTGIISHWPLNAPRDGAYDDTGSNTLAAINYPGAAHGPVEYEAREYAGVTKWVNQGLASGAFGNLTSQSNGGLAPQLVNGIPYWDGLAASLEQTSGTVLLPLTIVVIGKADADGPSVSTLFQGQSAGRKLIYINGNVLRSYDYGTPAIATSSNNGHNRFVAIAEFSDVANMRLVIDGIETVGDGVAADNLVGVALGGDAAGTISQTWKGNIEQVVIIPRLLTTAEETALLAL